MDLETENIDSAVDSGELNSSQNLVSDSVEELNKDGANFEEEVEDEDLDDALLEELLNAESEEEEVEDDEEIIAEDEGVEQTDDKVVEEAKKPIPTSLSDKISRLPLSRIKQIVKLDSDIDRVNGEATFLIAKSAELFLQSFAQEVYKVTARSKKKTIQMRDINTCIEEVICMQFLEGCFLEQL